MEVKRKAVEVIDVDKPLRVDQDVGTDKVQYLFTRGSHPGVSIADLQSRVKADDTQDGQQELPESVSQDGQLVLPDSVAQNPNIDVEDDDADGEDVQQALLDDNDANNPDVQQALLDSVARNDNKQAADDAFSLLSTQNDDIDDDSSEEVEEIIPPSNVARGEKLCIADNEESSTDTDEETNIPANQTIKKQQISTPSQAHTEGSEATHRKRFKQTVKHPSSSIRKLAKTPTERARTRTCLKRDVKQGTKYSQQRTIVASTRNKKKQPPKEIKKIHYKDFLDDNLQWTKDKPVGQGAIDLTGLTLGDEDRAPMFSDVQALSHNDWEPEQVDYSEAFRCFKQILGVQTTNEHRDFVAGLPTDKEREESNKERTTKLEQARLNSTLFNVHKVKYIAWIPEVTHTGKPVRNRDGTLSGKYSCKFEVEH